MQVVKYCVRWVPRKLVCGKIDEVCEMCKIQNLKLVSKMQIHVFVSVEVNAIVTFSSFKGKK